MSLGCFRDGSKTPRARNETHFPVPRGSRAPRSLHGTKQASPLIPPPSSPLPPNSPDLTPKTGLDSFPSPLPLSPLPGLWLRASKSRLIHPTAAGKGLANPSSTMTGPALNLAFIFNPLPRFKLQAKRQKAAPDCRRDKLKLRPGLHHLLSPHHSRGRPPPQAL